MSDRPSAAREALSKLEDQLKCLICLDPYTQPRLLACFHVYCQHCLDPLVDNEQEQQSVTCPKCRHSTPLPSSGTSGLQAAFHINNLFDIQKTLKKIEEPHKLACEKCSLTTRQATNYCRDCAEFICELCSTVHKEWKQFTTHEVVSIEREEGDLIRLVPPKKILRCSKHNEDIKFYCETCESLICRDCTDHIHKDHRFCMIADTYESHKEELLSSLEPVEIQLEAICTALLKLEGRGEEIVARRASTKAEIKQAFKEVRESFDTREEDLLAQLNADTQKKLEKVSAQRKELEILLGKYNNCIHFVRESVRCGNEADVLRMKGGVVKQIEGLVVTFQKSTLEPCEQANTRFIYSAQLEAICKIYGDLCHTHQPSMSKADKKSVAKLHLLHPNKPLALEARLISGLTQQSIKCTVEAVGKAEYKITYKPIETRALQLQVKVDGEVIRGRLLSMTTKTPIKKLEAVIKTIDGVEKPWGVAVNKCGELVVVEEKAGQVSIFSISGEKIRTIDTQGMNIGRMTNPQGVAVDSEDNILVVDGGNFRLLKFSREGDLMAAVGSEGDGPGQFKWPVDVCVNQANAKVYVTDNDANCVHILNPDLTYSSKFGSFGHGDEGELNRPCAIASDSNGCVYVANSESNRVKVFSAQGHYLRQFGRLGESDGQLNSPVSICVDDMVYVGETWNHRVSVFTSDGEFVRLIGSELGECFSPCGIAVGNGVVYICDNTNRQVYLF